MSLLPSSLGGDITSSSVLVRHSQGEVVQRASDLREHPPPLAVDHTIGVIVLVVIVAVLIFPLLLLLLLLLLQLPPLARERFEPPYLCTAFVPQKNMRRWKTRGRGRACVVAAIIHPYSYIHPPIYRRGV